ncbi:MULTISPECIES: Pepco domain-containing protein [Pseudanabaena]|uniref:Pepco domain-containing protein n=2 Tax=Pseudanabaena TaxID=1152 RepID=L8N190_9CYAN|nr:MULTISPECIES: hypothetical protein [Pseudanabaena]ELS33486.1 hypothetical protein Pse7429DRAFT_2109 [Pseudanabaena biceps PCC 7429]MDG3494294.1 hypothetical protein [Pseudanabaena catenata USMAC16]
MSEDASYGMITIAVEPYEQEPQSAETSVGNTRGWFSEDQPNQNSVKHEKTLSVAELEAKMSGFLQMVGRVFSSAEKEAKKTSGMSLDEIELSVEIGAEGEIRLIGSGAKASGKSAIKLKFKREKGV